MLRIKNSRPLTSKKPPEVLAENPTKEFLSCSGETPSSAILRVSGRTWYCRTSPPMLMT